MRWRILLKEFNFDGRYKEALLIMQADALSSPHLLEQSAFSVDSDILTYPLHFFVTPYNDRDGINGLEAELALIIVRSQSFFSNTSNRIRILRD